jgi:hypothetical protein
LPHIRGSCSAGIGLPLLRRGASCNPKYHTRGKEELDSRIPRKEGVYAY